MSFTRVLECLTALDRVLKRLMIGMLRTRWLLHDAGALGVAPVCILLVEDDYLIRQIALQVLQDSGFDVLAAEHGCEAYDHLDSYPGRFTLLVTDYNMPGALHGGHVVERMRSLYPAIPMILASANPGATSQEWRKRHKVELLVKPYFTEELVDLVEEMLH